MKKTMLLAAMAALVAGCDQFKTAESAPNCFSVVPGNSAQPFAPILVDGCTGRSWLLVKTPKSFKPKDGYTFQWFQLDRLDMLAPTLVSK